MRGWYVASILIFSLIGATIVGVVLNKRSIALMSSGAGRSACFLLDHDAKGTVGKVFLLVFFGFFRVFVFVGDGILFGGQV